MVGICTLDMSLFATSRVQERDRGFALGAGPTLKFHAGAVVALTGAEFEAQLDGVSVPCWASFAAPAGSTLTVGTVRHLPQRQWSLRLAESNRFCQKK